MKTLKITLISLFAALLVSSVVYQATAEVTITEIKLKECKNCKAGLLKVLVDYNGETYKGGTNLSAGFFCRKIMPETTLILKSKGFFNTIENYRN